MIITAIYPLVKMTAISANPAFTVSEEGVVTRVSDGFTPKITVRHDGYSYVCLDGKVYPLHKLLAQAFVPNPEKLSYVQHRDGNKSNNSIENLVWTAKRTGRKVGRAGMRGVTPVGKRFKAQVWDSGRLLYLGYYSTVEEASAAVATVT